MRRVLTAAWLVLVVAIVAAAAVLFVGGRSASNDAAAANKQTRSIDSNRSQVNAVSAKLRLAERRSASKTARAEAAARTARASVEAVRRTALRYDARANGTVAVQFDRATALNKAVDEYNAGNITKSKAILDSDSAKRAKESAAARLAQRRALAALDEAILRLRAVVSK